MATKPLAALGTLLSGAWQRFHARFMPLLWLNLPPALASVFVQYLFLQPTADGRIPQPGLGFGLMLLVAAWSVWVFASSILLLADGGERLSLEELYRKGGRYFWRIVGASILEVIGIGAGLIALVIPGIYLAVRWLPLQFALVEEDLGVFAAFRRSGELMSGHWWASFWRSFVVNLLIALGFGAVMILLLVAGFSFIDLGFALEQGGGAGLRGLWASLLLTALILPLQLYLYTFFYQLYRALKASR